jgi:hypothetical protein
MKVHNSKVFNVKFFRELKYGLIFGQKQDFRVLILT